ncbi:MAG TPA: helix-turn-helix transcriptional regulator [Actinomycetes bacterium]
MAAAGSTNREIAQALFVTLRTVEVHLTHAYRKLGIRSRADLAQALTGGPAAQRPDASRSAGSSGRSRSASRSRPVKPPSGRG